jgi:hypothetical protein
MHEMHARERRAEQPEPLAYDILESCRRDGIGRSTKYKVINPDPNKRQGLPLLKSFKVGKRRLILASDHRAWLETLAAQSGDAGMKRAAGTGEADGRKSSDRGHSGSRPRT